MITLSSYLTLAAILFAIGIAGYFYLTGKM